MLLLGSFPVKDTHRAALSAAALLLSVCVMRLTSCFPHSIILFSFVAALLPADLSITLVRCCQRHLLDVNA